MSKRKGPGANYLDYVPVRNPAFYWEQKEGGGVVVKVPHTGFFDRVAQRLFRKPEFSRIDLDELGSFVWLHIDGARTVYDIALLVREEFGEKAEPLLGRIVAFFGILRDQKFVAFAGEKEDAGKE